MLIQMLLHTILEEIEYSCQLLFVFEIKFNQEKKRVLNVDTKSRKSSTNIFLELIYEGEIIETVPYFSYWAFKLIVN